MDFATNPPGKKKFDSPSVLGAVIDLQFCLDLLNTVDLERMKFSYHAENWIAPLLKTCILSELAAA